MGLKVRLRTLFDQEGPDGPLKGERQERLVLLMAEMIRQAATGRGRDGKEVRNGPATRPIGRSVWATGSAPPASSSAPTLSGPGATNGSPP